MRNPAAKGKADSNHKAIADAIRLLGYPVMDLSHAGNGVEDLLVGLRSNTRHRVMTHFWVVVECKVPRNKTGTATRSQFKPGQKKWMDETFLWPRIVATSAQSAVDQIRELTR